MLSKHVQRRQAIPIKVCCRPGWELQHNKLKNPNRDEFQDLHLNLPVLEVLAYALIYNAMLDKYVESLELGKNELAFVQGEVFVKMEDLELFTLPGEEEALHWTTVGKRESYKPRPSSDRIGVQTPYYARKDFLDCHLLGEWEIARDAKINPFKDVLVFRRMVKFLGAVPLNLKRNPWESEDLIDNPTNWDKSPKDGDGTCHAKIRIIDLDGEEFTKTLQSILTTRKLSKRESPWEIINLDHFYDT
nr:hypothetical protein [Tanacetum cinerariifolium]